MSITLFNSEYIIYNPAGTRGNTIFLEKSSTSICIYFEFCGRLPFHHSGGISFFFPTDLLANQGPEIRMWKKEKKKALNFFFFTFKGKRVYPLSTTDGFKCSDYKILRVKWFNYKVNTASNLGWVLSVKTTDGVVQTPGQCLTRTLHSYCCRLFHGASVNGGAPDSVPIHWMFLEDDELRTCIHLAVQYWYIHTERPDEVYWNPIFWDGVNVSKDEHLGKGKDTQRGSLPQKWVCSSLKKTRLWN